LRRYWSRPPYFKPPRDRCEVCGASLYRAARYKVRLYIKPYGVLFKEIVVCGECLPAVRQECRAWKRRLKVRYRRMRPLKTWF